MITEHDTPASRGIDARLEGARPRPGPTGHDAVAAYGALAFGFAAGCGAGIAGTLLWMLP